jgi:hypothetical protein
MVFNYAIPLYYHIADNRIFYIYFRAGIRR